MTNGQTFNTADIYASKKYIKVLPIIGMYGLHDYSQVHFNIYVSKFLCKGQDKGMPVVRGSYSSDIF